MSVPLTLTSRLSFFGKQDEQTRALKIDNGCDMKDGIDAQLLYKAAYSHGIEGVRENLPLGDTTHRKLTIRPVLEL